MRDLDGANRLYSVEDSAKLLSISPWSLRKHITNGAIQVTRVGRRVLLSTETLERIRREGLPSLRENRTPSALPKFRTAMRIVKIGSMLLDEDQPFYAYMDDSDER